MDANEPAMPGILGHQSLVLEKKMYVNFTEMSNLSGKDGTC